jgi:hypothetical protein
LLLERTQTKKQTYTYGMKKISKKQALRERTHCRNSHGTPKVNLSHSKGFALAS